MAVWQFDFYIINHSNSLVYDENKSFDENEVLLNWEKQKIDKESILSIEKVLPSEKSWSSSIEQYGKIDETCIQISSLNQIICSVRIRLDLRNLSRVILFEIIEFIKINKGKLIYNNKCYLPKENILLNLLKESNAYKFCEDPKRYLTSYGKGSSGN